MKNIMNINLPRWVEALLAGGFILAMSLAAGCDDKNEGRISVPTEAIELTVTAVDRSAVKWYAYGKGPSTTGEIPGAFGAGRRLGSHASARITKPDGTSDFRIFAADLDLQLVVIFTALDYYFPGIELGGFETDVSLPNSATKILLSPGGDFVYILTASNQILVMNSVTYALDTPIVLQAGSNPVDMDVDSTGRIFVLLAPSTVQIVDPATRKVTTTQNVDSTPLSKIAVSPDGSWVALSGPATNTLLLDGSTLSPTWAVPTGGAIGLVFTPTGKSLYALGKSQLFDINLEANPPEIPFEPYLRSLNDPVPQPSSLRLSPGGSYLYFLNAADSSLRVWDTFHDTETESLSVRSGATDIAVVHSYTLKTLPRNLGTAPAWTITETHQGYFTQGQNGAAYTITVGNSGNGPVTGAQVTDTLPAGLTAVSLQGTGWTCSVGPPAIGCTRSDSLAAGASYPPLTLTVNVAANAPASVTNQVSVSGGGVASGVTTTDPTSILVALPASWEIMKTHQGTFTQGQNGAFYTIIVRNIGDAPTTAGLVQVTETLPTGLTAVSFQGTGWTCTLTGCNRADSLAAGGDSYPPLTLTVNVAANAPASVTNQVSVSGGGAVSASARDQATIVAAALPPWTITKTHLGNFTQGQNGATYTITVSNTGAGPTTAGAIAQVTDTLPTGLTAVSIQGTGWICQTAPFIYIGCNRSDSLAAGASYPPITLTVNVAANAPASVTNQVSVAGGGVAAGATATDPTTIVAAAALPPWTITKTHLGNFTQGQNGATYTITVKNTGAGPTTAGSIAQVMDTLPTGLTAVSIQGAGWICQTAPFIYIGCNRSDSLAAGASYPPITLTVNVAANAPASVTNQVSVSAGGFSSAATATDPTTIAPAAPVNVTLTVKTDGAGAGVGLQARIGTSGAYAPTPISQQVLLGQPQTISVLDPQFIAAANGGTGYKFSYWDLTGQPTTPTATLQPGSIDWPATLSDPTRNVFTEHANFQVACYELRVAVSPPGSGTVALSPASGGVPGMPANCYAPGTTVTITPTGNNAQDYVPSLPYPVASHIVMNLPYVLTENFVPYAAPQLTLVNLASAYSGANLRATGNLENFTGVNYNNIQITKVMWKLVPTGAAITDTTVLPIAIGNLGTLSGLVTITALFPNTLGGSYYPCVSGTAVSPLSGKTVTWSDFRYCPLFP